LFRWHERIGSYDARAHRRTAARDLAPNLP
jgi:hypothetical protein